MFTILYGDGNIIPMDNEIHSQYLKRAAYKGHEKAMLMYGLDLLQTSKDEKVQKESLFFIKKTSDAGYFDAIYYYGMIFEKGIGVPVDDKKAALYLRIAANNGHSDAMYQYGLKLSQEYDEEKETKKIKKFV